MTERRKLVAGNWKMNGLRAALTEVRAMVQGAAAIPGLDLVICPPATLASPVGEILKGSPVALGGQDCHPATSGAFLPSSRHLARAMTAQAVDAAASFIAHLDEEAA